MKDPPTQGGRITHAARSTLSNYIGQFITLAAWFLLTPFILHTLGTVQYGLWILISSLVAYGALLDFGVASAVTKYVSEYEATRQRQEAEALLTAALVIHSGLGLLVIALSVILAPILPQFFNIPAGEEQTAVWLIRLSGATVGFSIPGAIAPSILRGLQRFDLLNALNVTSTFLTVVATVVVLLMGGGVIGIVLVSMSTLVVMQLPYLWVIRRTAPDLRLGGWNASKGKVRDVVSFSLPVFAIHLGGQLETKTDDLVIGAFLPVRAIAPYDIARKLGSIPLLVTEQFLKILLPLASELSAENDRARLASLFIISTRLTLAIFLPFACTLAILAKPLLAAWVGPAYQEYAGLVLIIVLAGLIDTSQWPAGLILQGMGRHRPLGWLSLATGIANLILSVTLVQSFGLTGVAVGTLIPTTVVCLGFVLPYTMSVLNVSVPVVLRQILLPPLVPVALMVVTLILLRNVVIPTSLYSLAAIVLIGLLVYGVGYAVVGARDFERRLYQSGVSVMRQHALALLKRAQLS